MHELSMRDTFFTVWHPDFYDEVMEKALIENYIEQARLLSDKSPLPNLNWVSYEDRFLFQNDYMMKNLAYRMAGCEMYPATYELFSDADFERMEDDYGVSDRSVREKYTQDFLKDFVRAHELLRLTHVLQERAFDGKMDTFWIAGMRGGGFSCTN